ncbi:MAG: hypothetical protein RJB26_1323 [Pseudomonadota bacterium]|jgi:hypothetical protein
MTRFIRNQLLYATLGVTMIATPAIAQQPWQPPRAPQPQIVPAQPNGTIYTPQGMITRNGPYVMYPDGSTAIINQQGLSTWSNGAGCRTTGSTTYCW